MVSDRQIAPSKAVRCQSPKKTNPESNTSELLFSPEKEALYQERYEEKYDLNDPGYVAWLKINHPDVEVSTTLSESSAGRHSSGSECVPCSCRI